MGVRFFEIVFALNGEDKRVLTRGSIKLFFLILKKYVFMKEHGDKM